MAAVRIQQAASHRIDEIYRYTKERWSDEQADRYISGLFASFERTDGHAVLSSAIPVSSASMGSCFATSGISSIGAAFRTRTSAS